MPLLALMLNDTHLIGGLNVRTKYYITSLFVIKFEYLIYLPVYETVDDRSRVNYIDSFK